MCTQETQTINEVITKKLRTEIKDKPQVNEQGAQTDYVSEEMIQKVERAVDQKPMKKSPNLKIERLP